MKVLVVDDEPVARRRLVSMLAEIDGVEAAVEAGDAFEALERLDETGPDVLLLDIRMPGEDGLWLANRRRPLPPIIFTTAHSEHALEAFDAGAVDYLVKPVRRERLERALGRVRARGSAAAPVEAGSASPGARVVAREGAHTFLFSAADIARFFADDKYTCFRHGEREFLIEESLSALAERLGGDGFFRTHRAELVNLRRVRALRGAVLELDTGEIARVSRRTLPRLRRALEAI